MQNFLKPETIPTISTLKAANIKSIMATGDNGLTAIAVGKECGIISNDVPVFLGDVMINQQG